MLKQGVVNVSVSGEQHPPRRATGFNPNPGGMPFVTLKSASPASGPSGKVYAFTRTATDYAVAAITNLWYSWAQYYVQQSQNFAAESIPAYARRSPAELRDEQDHAWPSAPPCPRPGMTVTAPSVVPAGTTILKVDGNHIYLSQHPRRYHARDPGLHLRQAAADPLRPEYTTPYPAELQRRPRRPTPAQFAASVYEAMAAEAAVNPLPPSYLPYSMNLVSQVIQFYAKLPGYDRARPTGPTSSARSATW